MLEAVVVEPGHGGIETVRSECDEPHRPLCFVLMPFGRKPAPSGATIDFDAVYRDVIRPAICDAGLAPIRADEELGGGIIHKPMFERLILCDYAVADLTTANANVFYELGVRHAVRPHTTVLIAAEGNRPPFDLAMERRLHYALSDAGLPTNVEAARHALTGQLVAAKEAMTDSPIFQLLTDLPVPVVDRLKTDIFRQQVEYSERAKRQLATARSSGVDALRAVEAGLGPIRDVEAGVVIDLFLSYRAVRAWDDMIGLVDRMPKPLGGTVLVQEQLGFALNRLERRAEAEDVLRRVIERHGPSSETFGLLGRVYKDRWRAALGAGQRLEARGFLDRAIETYLRGYAADQRDPYPGLNALTLIEVRGTGHPRQAQLLAAVGYALGNRLASGQADYWDEASRVELAILQRDEAGAIEAAGDALAAVREPWEAESTAGNLRMIREAREARGDALDWARQIEDELASVGRRS
jgi:tetratricopeptide (TPR) repeat protein